MERSNGSNTVILVIILLVIVGALVWYFTMRNDRVRDADSNDATVQVTIPAGNGSDTQGGM